jgi:membrane fusion protein (multidrug efflux system)
MPTATETIDEPLVEKTPSESESSRPRPRSFRVVLILAILAVVAGAAWGLSAVMGGTESTDDAQIDGHIVSISPRISGTVVAVNVQDNQTVKAGEVLVKIDPRDYEVLVAKAKADLADAEATARALQAEVPITTITTQNTISNTRAGEVDAQRSITASERQLEAALARVSAAKAKLEEEQANADRASSDQARFKQLVDKDEISRQQYDAAVAAAKAGRASVESARANGIEAEHQVDVARAQLEQGRARLDQARAQVNTALTAPDQISATRARYESAKARVEQQRALLDQALLNLSYTTITAPLSGIVGRKTVELGHTVSPGQQMLVVVPSDDIWITANFKETQLKGMRPGQRAKVHVDSYDRDYEGKIESIAAASGAKYSLLPPENATGNYVKVVQRVPVRIRLDGSQDPQHLLRPGMSVVPKVYVN